jgi:peptide/nickel transport system substrate-binding protein
MVRGAIAVALAGTVAGCHCGGDRGREDDGAGITVLVESDIGTLDPRFAASSYEIKVSRLVFSGLTTADTPDLSVEPLLAESIEVVDEEGLEWEVVLREGLRFHDGEPITSADVVYTYRSVLDPGTQSRYRATYSYIEEVRAVDERTVRFRLREVNAAFPPDLTLPVLPEHVLAPAGGRFPEGAMVGSGPFELVSRSRGRIVLRRTDGARVVFMTVRDDNARVLRLQGGGADLAQNNIPVYLLGLFEGGGTRVVTTPGASFTYLGVNLESPPLDDRRVREALAVAIDREGIVEHKLESLATVASGMLPPQHWAYAPAVSRAHDPARAARMLDEAGYPDPDGGGPEKRFTLTFKTSSNRFRLAIARVIAANLREVGIGVELRPFEFSTLRAHLDAGAYQLTCLQIPMVTEPNLYRWFFHSGSIPDEMTRGGANRWRYRSAEADALIERGARTVDEAARRRVYAELQELLGRDLPVVPLWHEDSVAVVSDRLAGYELLPTAPFTPLADALH